MSFSIWLEILEFIHTVERLPRPCDYWRTRQAMVVGSDQLFGPNIGVRHILHRLQL